MCHARSSNRARTLTLGLSVTLGILLIPCLGTAEISMSLIAGATDRQDTAAEVALFLTGDSDQLARIDQFDITLTFDRSLVTFAGLTGPDIAAWGEWNLSFIMVQVDTVWTGQNILRLVAARQDSIITVPSLPEPFLHLRFRPTRDDFPIGTEAPLRFAWLSCRDNRFVMPPDTILVAGTVRDENGYELMSEEHPPTLNGISDSCLVEITAGDSVVIRDIVFESTSIRIDAATGVDDPSPEELPASFRLRQNYPNPFNAGTTISFRIPRRSPCQLDIFDISGRLVRQYHGEHGPGQVVILWDGKTGHGTDAASGVYVYRVTTDNYSATRKMLLLR